MDLNYDYAYIRSSPTLVRSYKKNGSALQWPADRTLPCDHAGLLLLFPAMAELGLADLVAGCGYPATRLLSASSTL